jgi:energy-coupling factor transporter ATP-binding protein EcfA2
MATSTETIRKIDEQIKISNEAICRQIESVDFHGRGVVSQTVLKLLRDFVEHIMFKIYAEEHDVEYHYDNIKDAISFVKTKGQLKFLWKFHAYLQIVASHYTLDPENSERVMIKYYEYLLKIKDFVKDQYSVDVLENLGKFPLNMDKNMQEYYEKIAAKLSNRNARADLSSSINGRYYVHKVKPFFVNQRVYYEVTFIPATGKASKFDRIIAFTTLDISKYYAVKLWTVEDSIQILEKTMPIFIIVRWEVSIRPCEIRRFSNLFDEDLQHQGSSSEYRGLMYYLSQTGYNLVELLLFEDVYYLNAKSQILSRFNAKANHIFDLLDKAREIIRDNRPGHNVLRYLLYHLNNKVIIEQLAESNTKLSGLCLAYGCIPFDKMPFNTSLLGHNPKLGDLFDCLDATDRMHEVLARFVNNNTEKQGQLYTPVKDLEGFGDVGTLVQTYNGKLYNNERHQGRRIEKRNQHLYIRNYEQDTIAIIRRLVELSGSGIQNYSGYVAEWLSSNVHPVDCEEKRSALQQMFENSTVALIYGSAGTGKSTLINHISHLFSQQDKLYLANTNPAVDNLKRRVDASNCEFMTTTKFLKKQNIQTKYNILVIDECSTVNNRDMRAILERAEFDLLILVGDIFQIEAIQFGNWFTAARGFLPTSSIYELSTPYRSKDNKALQTLWDRVRQMEDTIIEFIARQGYSISLDPSIFNPAENDEIILCLNYDGLYGINNINRFLQEANPSPAIAWELQLYKVGDPVLFNESERFAPLIYNNMKGWIAGIAVLEKQIQFDVELEKVINGLEARYYDFELLPNSPNGHSVIRFLVNQYKSTEEDDDASSLAVVPFQVSYAVSIHKAQGLEYNSVKIVITDEIDDLITHDIFYTAITRTRNKLKIYWTPEVEQRVLSRIKPKDNNKDIALLKQANAAT